MAIKGQLARLERQLAKTGGRMLSFVIPYCRDREQSKNLKQEILIQNGLDKSPNVTVVFVMDYSTRSLRPNCCN